MIMDSPLKILSSMIRVMVDKDLSHLGEVIKSPNVGANQFDILRFIIENYENLPDMSIFIKGNLFSRGENYYTTEERFHTIFKCHRTF